MWALAEDPDFEGWSSGKMHIWLKENGHHAVQKGGRRGVSRASVIMAMNRLVDDHVLDYTEETGKGGYRKIYRPAMNPRQYAKHVYNTVGNAMDEIFTGDWWRLP